MKLVYLICSGWLVSAAGAALVGDGMQLDALSRINSETEVKVQGQVLDRLLGPGRAVVFLETRAEVAGTIHEESKDGIGTTQVTSQGGPVEGRTEAAKPGKDKKEDIKQDQTASQARKSVETSVFLNLVISSITAWILYDSSVPAKKLEAVKAALLALYPGRIGPDGIVFIPAAFEPSPAR